MDNNTNSDELFKPKVIHWASDICFDLLNNNIINKINNTIDESKKIKKEVGFNIDKNCNITDYCEGHKCSLKLKKPKKAVGNFHTHPLSDISIFSNADLKDTFIKNYDFACLGIKDEATNYIRCLEVDKNEEYEILNNKYEKFKKIEKKYKKADDETKLRMLQEDIFKEHPMNDIIDFMKKQNSCLIKTKKRG